MNTARTLFPGAMGPDGFISCFDHLIRDCDLRRKLILKGGPGVGKSTFMRRLHAELGMQDEHATLYFCSGDPDSLDAVALPGCGLLILDGTAPHVVDPAVPGARDSIVNLGVCLDEAAMRPRLPHVRACMEDHAVCMQRAQACLRAAYALRKDNASIVAGCIDETRMARMTGALIASVFAAHAQAAGAAHRRPVITDAVTHKGEMCLLAEGLYRRVIRLNAHAAMDLTPVLRAVSSAAAARGYDVEEHLAPAMPGSLLHLSVPALSTLVTTAEIPSEQTFDFAAVLPSASLLRRECMLDQAQAMIARHVHHAVSALSQAKQLHDELETFYVPNMDFSRWQSIFDGTLKSLKAP